MNITNFEAYKNQNELFKSYPDVVSVKQLQEMLGDISSGLAYRLIKDNQFTTRKIGREYRITKSSVIAFMLHKGVE